MSLTHEDLLSMSQLLDCKLQPLTDRIKNVELLLENDILPRISRASLSAETGGIINLPQ